MKNAVSSVKNKKANHISIAILIAITTSKKNRTLHKIKKYL